MQAGAARIDLEMPPGVPLGGDVHRLGRAAVGVHDSIGVRALYLEDDDTGIVVVSADLHSITPELRARVLELAPVDLAASHIILTATHTHSGPGGLSKSWFARRYMGGYMEEMVELAAQGIVEAIAEAMTGKKRATIGYRVSTQELLTENLFSEGGIRDAQVGVIRVDDSDGNPIAILGSMSAHPTTTPASDVLALSAGFPGYFCDRLESLSHEDTVAFFLNGATGDQACANRENMVGWDWPEFIGNELAILVKSVANTIECEEYPILINYSTADVPENLASRFLSDEVLIQTLEIDQLLVSFFPGEPYAGVQDELDRIAKRRGYSAHITVGLANDYVMDIASTGASVFRGAAPGLNVLGPDAEEWSVDVIQTLMRRGSYTSRSSSVVRATALQKIPGGYRVEVSGGAEDRVLRLGATMAPLLEEAWAGLVRDVRDGVIEVELPIWGDRFGIDATPIALPILADRERGHLSADAVRDIGWFARGARMPFDKVHLLRHFSDVESVPRRVSVEGTRGRGGLEGYIASASAGTPVIVLENRPATGSHSVGIGLPWDSTHRIGMNDAGVVFSSEAGSAEADVPDLESAAASRGDLEEALREAALKLFAETDSELLPVVFAVIFEPASKSVYLAVSEGDTFPTEFQRFSVVEDSP